LDTASAFVKAFLHLLAGEGGWGMGMHLPRKQRDYQWTGAITMLQVLDFALLVNRSDKHHQLSGFLAEAMGGIVKP
jgi:hypothetical protein